MFGLSVATITNPANVRVQTDAVVLVEVNEPPFLPRNLTHPDCRRVANAQVPSRIGLAEVVTGEFLKPSGFQFIKERSIVRTFNCCCK